ncbi:MAG TPA: DUF3108 domain-containing protein [Bryobacteraceae bacterium]|nr:DUF3108 domain-containing protein [Bryobacteraceae bacterium]
MQRCFRTATRACAWIVLIALSYTPMGAQGDGGTARTLPSSETLQYSVEWRLINAGNARLSIEPAHTSGSQWEAKVHLESVGMVSKLYRLDDNYAVRLEDQFCATGSDMSTIEGKKRRETKVQYDRSKGRATYSERDLLKNGLVDTKEIEVPTCVSDVVGGLYKLRLMHLEPGQSTQIPTSDGKKSAAVRIEAQAREEIKTKLGTFKTIRYEAFIFNGVIYSKKASMLVWITDDARRLPVQMRARMSFPIGSITLQLDKETHS